MKPYERKAAAMVYFCGITLVVGLLDAFLSNFS
jgi:hypothetical protein